MKNVLAIALLCLLWLSLAAAGQKTSKKGTVEDQIKEHEQNWAQATIKEGAAAVDCIPADHIISDLPSGRVTQQSPRQDGFELGRSEIPIHPK